MKGRHSMNCPHSGCSYHGGNLGSHWYMLPEHRPSLSDRQVEIVTGLMLGDACVDRSTKNARLQVGNVNVDFLKWVKDELQPIARDIEVQFKEGERHVIDGTYDCQEFRLLRTVTHPGLNRFAEWYSGEGKQFPDDLELTPLIAKVWYCCDGGIASRDKIGFTTKTQISREDYLKSLFPFDCQVVGNSIRFSSRLSKKMLDWMGDPLPGMSYKWI